MNPVRIPATVVNIVSIIWTLRACLVKVRVKPVGTVGIVAYAEASSPAFQ
jgi:hypothetical protein